MSLQISYLPYRREFCQPLLTGHGRWTHRDGFIVRIQDSEGIGYGEVAPIDGFGSESLEEARECLDQVVVEPELCVPSNLPCCRFALSSAKASRSVSAKNYSVSALLSAGELAISQLKEKALLGYDSFKWKIGVQSVKVEIALFHRIIESMPEGAKLRLDANGALDTDTLDLWLSAIQAHVASVDYLEQPLPVGDEAVMAGRAIESGVAIALDESLNGENGRLWLEKWQGPLVVKPALMGAIEAQASLLCPVAERVVISSVFETSVGVLNVLNLADRLDGLKLPIGYDTLGAFHDRLQHFEPGPFVCSKTISATQLDQIWQLLLRSS